LGDTTAADSTFELNGTVVTGVIVTAVD
jgi:hypothetical protein